MSAKNVPVWLHTPGEPKKQVGLSTEPKDGVSSVEFYPEFKGKGLKDITIGDAPIPEHLRFPELPEDLEKTQGFDAAAAARVEETAEFTPDASFEAPEQTDESGVVPEIPVTDIILESKEEFAEHAEVSNGDPANDNETDAAPAEGALATPVEAPQTRREARIEQNNAYGKDDGIRSFKSFEPKASGDRK